ncbi:hypothetical protein [Kineothrix sp. MB12-C1]|uniref:hypothetical protein n=1 Tax=Kineothrix sp. MB12-C1 TaxID=3070215 RepID=UPI0027D28F62|nr:hypothetical protein [Kineothrix sp. MB12-C1]WMC92267.1 hypothetical protein RBB56_15660 [Kineothrix sp. MB12-C1]
MPHREVGQSISHYPRLVFGVALFSRFPLLAGQPVYRCVPPPRSPGSGRKGTAFKAVMAGIAEIV